MSPVGMGCITSAFHLDALKPHQHKQCTTNKVYIRNPHSCSKASSTHSNVHVEPGHFWSGHSYNLTPVWLTLPWERNDKSSKPVLKIFHA